MKLLLDDKAGKAFGLNANEACVYAAILKCTKAGRGWYASMQAFAEALPFVIDRKTVTRAVQKLLNLGLIERRENALFVSGQNDQSNGQNDRTNDQFDQSNGQNDRELDSPYNPLINNNDMKNEKDATCANTCDTRTPETPSLKLLIEAYKEKGGNDNGYYIDLAREAWEKCTPAKKTKLLAAVRSGAHFKAHIHWLITDFPEPTPDFLRGDEDCPIVQVRYNGLYKLCTPETMRLFGLDFVRWWKK